MDNASQSEFNLSGNDPDQYPLLPEVNDEESIILPSTVLKNIINQTNFAVSLSETRPVLTGVNWQFQDSGIQFTATDSHRIRCCSATATCASFPGSLKGTIRILPVSSRRIMKRR